MENVIPQIIKYNKLHLKIKYQNFKKCYVVLLRKVTLHAPEPSEYVLCYFPISYIVKKQNKTTLSSTKKDFLHSKTASNLEHDSPFNTSSMEKCFPDLLNSYGLNMHSPN